MTAPRPRVLVIGYVLIRFRNRLMVMTDWAWAYFT